MGLETGWNCHISLTPNGDMPGSEIPPSSPSHAGSLHDDLNQGEGRGLAWTEAGVGPFPFLGAAARSLRGSRCVPALGKWPRKSPSAHGLCGEQTGRQEVLYHLQGRAGPPEAWPQSEGWPFVPTVSRDDAEGLLLLEEEGHSDLISFQPTDSDLPSFLEDCNRVGAAGSVPPEPRGVGDGAWLVQGGGGSEEGP